MIPKQREPTSNFVRTCLHRIGPAFGLALDVPCGMGRHTELLANQGLFVIAADIDRSCLRVLQQWSSARTPAPPICAIQLDAGLPLPFRAGVFDLVVVVHPPFTTVLFNAAPTVRKGGHLIFETFGAQGENWRALPHPGHVAATLLGDFETLVYRERAVRLRPEAVTVKGLFRRR